MYGQQPYSSPPQYTYSGYGPGQETESLAVVALVLAIASFVVCPIFPAIASLIVAGRADEYIRVSGGRKTGEGMVKAARIVSWVNIGFTVLLIVGAVVAAFFVAIASD